MNGSPNSDPGSVRIFAYGSNMLVSRFVARAPRARLLGVARLPGYRITWDKRSVDGSGKCHVEQGLPHEMVWGVGYECAPSDLRSVDAAEGPGYERVTVTVELAGQPVDMHCYRARSHWRSAGLLPYDWYRELVLAGACEHGHPSEYVAALRAVPAVTDPDPNRPGRLAALAALGAHG